MEEVKKCSATNARITNDKGSVTFKCPKCSDYEIVRSKHARQIVGKYTCPKCGFTGPN
ncbi:zinc finger domain-containing protein [Candidatus Woesearchaeota archaeon]|nr:zinc finger domain-containing protein [Candidatus Woesearchaeota archaeon]MCF7900729.1 zinc finger domain-containing protein [Candidatus Woesearchaeota archaeon]MCF8013250.1 zinc finger domain-containing protein [Candidatus Woesearchaeota archaeon]